ncbi:hypothetical protein lerEdw1_020691 [Lerista edwardsae]|nr:hypothetical protein lerEdw1_020691 [Lerista edwardsae]
MSLHQLNELLEDEEQLQTMAREMEEALNVQLNKDMTLAGNCSLAEGNLLDQPKLDALKAALTQKYQTLQVLFEAYQIKKTKLGNASLVTSFLFYGQSSNASLETLLALLQAEGAKIEEDSPRSGKGPACTCSFCGEPCLVFSDDGLHFSMGFEVLHRSVRLLRHAAEKPPLCAAVLGLVAASGAP